MLGVAGMLLKPTPRDRPRLGLRACGRLGSARGSIRHDVRIVSITLAVPEPLSSRGGDERRTGPMTPYEFATKWRGVTTG